MENGWVIFTIIILGILCFAFSIWSFTNIYNLLCEMNPDNSVEFGTSMFIGLAALILGIYSIINAIK